MIIVKIAGGLGNQLFKLNKALELKKNYKNLYIDLTGFKTDRYKRNYHFKNKLNQLKIFFPIYKKILIKTNKILTKLNLLSFYAEEENDLKLKEINDKPYIKYITGSWEENVLPSKENIDIFNNIFGDCDLKNNNIVAVHFRTKDYGIKLDDVYYLNAIKQFNQNYSFHIFGDDIDYLKIKVPELFINLDYKIISISDPIKSFEELKTYKNYISSNSTFCWWAIILNKQENLNVIGPEIWMDREYNIYRPSSWKLI